VFEKTFQHGPVLAQRVRLLEGFDLAEVSGDRHVQGAFLPSSPACSNPFFPSSRPSRSCFFAPLRFKRLDGGDPGRSAPAFSGQIHSM